jgi:hypothetical protein
MLQRFAGRRGRCAGLAFSTVGWCSTLVDSGLHSSPLGFVAATAGHTDDPLRQESMKKAVLACVEKEVGWRQKTYLEPR